MKNPIILYGESVNKNFFYGLLSEGKSKYLTDFKRYFNYLKKNHQKYKGMKLKDMISIDQPLLDYVEVINDWLAYETKDKYIIYMNNNESLYFGFKINNPVRGDDICKLVKDWNNKKEIREDYFKWISIFEKKANGPLFIAIN